MGPYSARELTNALEKGQLSTAGSYWCDGMGGWRSLAEWPHTEKGKMPAGFKVLVALGPAVAIVFLIAIGLSSTRTGHQATKGSPSVSVGASGLVVQLTNRATDDWPEAVVYLNDRPPFTYKWEGRAPAKGESIRIPLSEFTKDDGERFDGLRRKVTQVWVGGSGYDYVGFNFR